MVESYALDAIDWFEPGKEHKALKSEVTKFRKAAFAANAQTHPAVGLGTNCRLESKKVTGFALTLNEQVLHISIFTRADGKNTDATDSRIERFSKRRRNPGV